MKLDQLRDYLTMPEVAMRWKATDPEMCRAILKGLLKPSLFVNEMVRPATVSDKGDIELVEADGQFLTGWHYLTPIRQVDALDCTAQTVSVTHEVGAGAAMWALNEAVDMQRLLKSAVVMADDLIQAETALEAETHWQQRSAKTKEFNSVLNILSIVLAEAYHYDPRVRSTVVREVTDAGELHGIAVSNGTVSKWLKEAIEQFPPGYMDEAVRGIRAVEETA